LKAAARAACGAGRPETRAAARAVAVVAVEVEGGGSSGGAAAAAAAEASPPLTRGVAAAAAAAVALAGALGGLPLGRAAADAESLMTVPDCSSGRFLGVRTPPEAAAEVLLAGVDAAEALAALAFAENIAPRPRAGVIEAIAVAARADFWPGVASFAPESRTERLVVRADAAFAALGSVAAAVTEGAADERKKELKRAFGEIGERTSIFSSLFSIIIPFALSFYRSLFLSYLFSSWTRAWSRRRRRRAFAPSV